MITCPAKICLSEIEEDSIYCDQCGIELLICPKCGNLGEKKFCPKDGTKMISRKTSSGNSPSVQTQQSSPPPQVEEPKTFRAPPVREEDSAKTKIQPRSTSSLKIRHTSGKELDLHNGDILGRKNGAHAGFLGSFGYISGTHASVRQEGGRWFLTDLGSSNGTRVNGAILEPKKEVALENGMKLELADQEFVVVL